ncbi:MAG: metallophosphoesterase family protein, partial [Gemmatimonadota bacterium]|nr:metallophosphoesterase family protein [Gemmatimonadota bacterium]
HRVGSFDQLADVFPGAGVIVHGHSHVPRDDLEHGIRMLNPGSAGPGGAGWTPSIAIAEVRDGEIHVVHLALANGSALEL